MTTTVRHHGEDRTVPTGRRLHLAGLQVLLASLLGLAAGLVLGLLTPLTLPFALLLGFDVAAAAYILQVWLRSYPLDAPATAQIALREDPTRSLAGALLLVVSVAALGGVGYAVASASSLKEPLKALSLTTGVLTILLSWFLVHTVYTLKYAQAHYEGNTIDFNTDESPVWTDFAYVAFTIGMTFQVSDTDLKTQRLRRTALGHMFLSYLFGAVIIAASINIIAGLAH